MKHALLRLHLAVFLWGFTGTLGKLISLNEAWLVWWRLLITVISLWIFFFYNRKIIKISWREFIKISLIGTVLSLHWLCFYGSIKYSNVSIALTCLSTSGLMSAIVEPIFFRRRISFIEVFLGLFALAGISLIYVSNLNFSTGIYIGLAAAFLSVLASVLNKNLIDGFKPETITLYQLTGGFIGFSLLLPFYNYLFPAKEIFPHSWDGLWLIILSWLCTIFTFMLFLSALKKVSAFTLNLTLTWEPLYGIILAFIVFHENKYLSNNFYIGFTLIFAAVLVQMVRLIKEHRKIALSTT